MWALDKVADAIWNIGYQFYRLADTLEEIPLLGGYLSTPFSWVWEHCVDAVIWVRTLSMQADELIAELHSYLSWDTIQDKIILTLFGGKRPWDWFWDMAWYWLDLYFPWLRDPELTVWEWVRDKVSAMIPVDFVKPWEVWDLIVDKIRELIPIDFVAPWEVWDLIVEKVKELIPDLKSLELDPVGWISEKMGNIMGRFLAVAAWPFLYAIAGLLERNWDEPSEEEGA